MIVLSSCFQGERYFCPVCADQKPLPRPATLHSFIIIIYIVHWLAYNDFSLYIISPSFIVHCGKYRISIFVHHKNAQRLHGADDADDADRVAWSNGNIILVYYIYWKLYWHVSIPYSVTNMSAVFMCVSLTLCRAWPTELLRAEIVKFNCNIIEKRKEFKSATDLFVFSFVLGTS